MPACRSAGALLAPDAWRQLTDLLPCEWNWQTCVWSYGRANECPLYDGKPVCAAPADARVPLHDGSCHTPPRLLHFDCPGDLKALLDTDNVSALRRGVAIPPAAHLFDYAHHHRHGAASESGDGGGGGDGGGESGGGDGSDSGGGGGIGTSGRGAGRVEVEDTIASLNASLHATRAAAMCRRADGRLGGLASRTFCNASFLLTRLLTRHASEV